MRMCSKLAILLSTRIDKCSSCKPLIYNIKKHPELYIQIKNNHFNYFTFSNVGLLINKFIDKTELSLFKRVKKVINVYFFNFSIYTF